MNRLLKLSVCNRILFSVSKNIPINGFDQQCVRRISSVIAFIPPTSTTSKWDQDENKCRLNQSLELNFRRNKSNKSSKSKDSDNESDDELEDFNEMGTKDKSLIKIKVQSLRLDLLIKSVLQMPRNKIEKLFYESKIRLNGKKVLKKSISVKNDDEIDVIKSVSPLNPDNLVVSRIELLSSKVSDDEEHIIIVARRFKSLTIENYPGQNVYKSSNDEE